MLLTLRIPQLVIDEVRGHLEAPIRSAERSLAQFVTQGPGKVALHDKLRRQRIFYIFLIGHSYSQKIWV